VKRKGYAIVRIHIQREIEIELDDEIESSNDDIMPQIERIVAEKYGELNLDIDGTDKRRHCCVLRRHYYRIRKRVPK